MTLDYGYGPGGLGGRVWQGNKLIYFFPDPERHDKRKYNEKVVK